MPISINNRGEIIRSSSRGYTPIPSLPSGRNTGGGFKGWWIIVLLLLFIGIVVISNWSNKESSSNVVTQQIPPINTPDNSQNLQPPKTIYTAPESTDNQNLQPPKTTYTAPESTDNQKSAPNENPYGEGNGKITLYKTCNYCPDLKVSVDGEYIGTLTQTLNNSAECDDYGTISKILSAGNHIVTGIDSYGFIYNYSVTVYEGKCATVPFSKSNDVNPYPYGKGNGQITIYHNCSYCNNIKVSVDGYYIGTLTKYYKSGSPICGTEDYGATIVKTLLAGNHNVTAKDDYGNIWSGNVYVLESDCKTYLLESIKKASPYGYNKGMVSFFTSSQFGHDIYVDGKFYGSLDKYFTGGSATCDQIGTLSIILSAGEHRFEARDRKGAWIGRFTILPDECTIIQVNRSN